VSKKNTRKTPRSKVKQALRQLWMWSRERATALKENNYTCSCGKKQSKAKGKEIKIEVHHKNGIDWEELIDLVYARLLQTPEDYEIMCVDCHREYHEER
jgi:hypothetical protein